MRTINLLIDSDDMAEVMGAVHAQQLKAALGYLVSWGIDGYSVVDIRRDGKTDLLAVYYNLRTPADRRYVIGAIWRSDENRYTFHS